MKHSSFQVDVVFRNTSKLDAWSVLCQDTLKKSNTILSGCYFCRNTLSEVLCLLRGLPHRLLWLPAVLHRQAELGLHLLLQHPALQRAQEEASHPLGGDVQPADEPASSPLPDPLPAVVDTPPCDVD